MFGDNGTMKEVTKTFKDKCSKWPSELGQHDCLAQEFCLYSGVACHAKLKTELEEAKDVASILHLPKEGNRKEARMLMIEITTSNSIKVNFFIGTPDFKFIFL